MDGIESEGVCFEQDIENNIYSKYLGPESFLLRMLDGSVVLGDYESLLTKMMQGLLLDTIGSKIYLNGVRLTSKEIHSQSTTIEVLTALLVHPQKEIRNTELPVSSYSKNKNDMLGKIVLPLIKLLEEQKGIKFPLSCKGSPDDFFLKLGETSLEIGFLERL